MAPNIRRFEYLARTPFVLNLSSGFFGFYAHLGFVEAFDHYRLKPRQISGCSAGSLVAAAVASGIEIPRLKEILFQTKREDFWDPALGFGFLKGEKLEKALETYLVSDFSQTQIPLSISAFNLKTLRTDFIQEGSIAKACRASSAVPLFFHPTRIASNLYWDGGVFDRPALGPATSDVRVMHYLKAGGLWAALEDKLLYAKLHREPFFVKTENAYRMGPGQLHKGPEVTAHFFKKTCEWLEESISL